MQISKIIFLFSLVFLVACDGNPLQTIGTVSGATAGGIIGAQIGGDGIGATIGGAIGAVTGKVAGSTAGAMGDAAIQNARRRDNNNLYEDNGDNDFYEEDDFDWETGTVKQSHDIDINEDDLYASNDNISDDEIAHIDENDLFINDSGRTCYYISANNYAQADNNITRQSACLNDDGKWFLDESD